MLAFLGLFTQYDFLWIFALLLAFIELPDFEAPLVRLAASLAKLAGVEPRSAKAEPKPHLTPFESLDASFVGKAHSRQSEMTGEGGHQPTSRKAEAAASPP